MKCMRKLFYALLLISLSGCEMFSPPESPVSYTELTPVHYSSDSFWFKPIADDAAEDENSINFINALVEEHRRDSGEQTMYELLVIVSGGTAPVYKADDSTQRISIPIMTSGYGAGGLTNVPFPDYTFPDPASDGHCVIVDTVNRKAFDFWQLRNVSGRWFCSAAAVSSLDGNGVHDKKFSVTASGFGLLGGLIWPEELRSETPGAINHALAFGYPLTKLNSFVSPAARSDGWSEDPAALPMGACLQLNPSLDLNTLTPPLTPVEMRVAEALQTYGMYLYDTGSPGSIVELDAVGIQSFSEDPYTGISRYDSEGGYIDLGNIPLDELRVLELGEINTWGTQYPAETAFEEYYYER